MSKRILARHRAQQSYIDSLAMSTNSDDDEELKLFRKAMTHVKPLRQRRVHLEKIRPRVPRPEKRSYLNLEITGQQYQADQTLGSFDRLSYLTSGLNKDVLRRLRKGYFGIDAELDLHGLTEYEANRHLQQFLNIACTESLECVHIIHGKGSRSEQGYPVLKNLVDQRLRQHPAVLAFCSASPSEGGTGAVFVLLSVR